MKIYRVFFAIFQIAIVAVEVNGFYYDDYFPGETDYETPPCKDLTDPIQVGQHNYTCEEISKDHSAKCYNYSIHPKCCKSCEAIEDNRGLRRLMTCNYGDRDNLFCPNIKPWQCYDYQLQYKCCETCYAKYSDNTDAFTNLFCTYGDRQENCKDLKTLDDCMKNGVHFNCCKTCKEIERAGLTTESNNNGNGQTQETGDVTDSSFDCKNGDTQDWCNQFAKGPVECQRPDVLRYCCETCRKYNGKNEASTEERGSTSGQIITSTTSATTEKSDTNDGCSFAPKNDKGFCHKMYNYMCYDSDLDKYSECCEKCNQTLKEWGECSQDYNHAICTLFYRSDCYGNMLSQCCQTCQKWNRKVISNPDRKKHRKSGKRPKAVEKRLTSSIRSRKMKAKLN